MTHALTRLAQPLLSQTHRNTISEAAFEEHATFIQERKAQIAGKKKLRERVAYCSKCIFCALGACCLPLLCCCPPENKKKRFRGYTMGQICGEGMCCVPNRFFLTDVKIERLSPLERQEMSLIPKEERCIQMQPFLDAIEGHTGLFNITLEYLG